VKAAAQATHLTQMTQTAVVIPFTKLTGFGAYQTAIGLPVGYKQKELLTAAPTYSTQQPTHAPWLLFGVTAVGYHGKQQTKCTNSPTPTTP
jgi:hypothetical protein